eukprot:scaffold375784_cov17-Prasinocladus_malaysianus.AAC.1
MDNEGESRKLQVKYGHEYKPAASIAICRLCLCVCVALIDGGRSMSVSAIISAICILSRVLTKSRVVTTILIVSLDIANKQ